MVLSREYLSTNQKSVLIVSTNQKSVPGQTGNTSLDRVGGDGAELGVVGGHHHLLQLLAQTLQLDTEVAGTSLSG